MGRLNQIQLNRTNRTCISVRRENSSTEIALADSLHYCPHYLTSTMTGDPI
jgi:hypothetical protein